MAKKKKSSKQGWMSKAINAGLTLLAFSRPLLLLSTAPQRGSFDLTLKEIIREATFGLSEGGFDKDAGLRMYTPVGAAAALGFIRSYATKHFPVRR